MTAPILRTVYPNGSVELGGVMYVQVPYDQPRKAKDPCWWCVAYNNMGLCDMIAPYCQDKHVFAQKMPRTGRKGADV